jgi:hypothetical protein
MAPPRENHVRSGVGNGALIGSLATLFVVSAGWFAFPVIRLRRIMRPRELIYHNFSLVMRRDLFPRFAKPWYHPRQTSEPTTHDFSPAFVALWMAVDCGDEMSISRLPSLLSCW